MGWLTQIAATIGGLAAVIAFTLLAVALGHAEWTPFVFLAGFVAVIVALQVIAHRHGPDLF
jgi:hypothetical protein